MFRYERTARLATLNITSWGKREVQGMHSPAGRMLKAHAQQHEASMSANVMRNTPVPCVSIEYRASWTPM